MEICLAPVGYVEEGMPPGASRRAPKHGLRGRIRIYPEYREALKGLEEYSHAYLISYLHRASRSVLVDASRHGGPARLGAFAARYPSRPNPLGLTIVQVVRVDANSGVLDVLGIDLYTGTPILDVKPYDYFDVVSKPRVPEWFHRFWESRVGT